MRLFTLGLLLVLLSPTYSSANKGMESFQSFISRVLDNSNPVQIKALELEAENIRAKQTDYYYLPKVSTSGKIKSHDGSTNSNVTVSSLIYDTTLSHRFNEKDLKLQISALSLNKEKEELYTAATGNLIGIYYLNELTETTADLNNNAKNIFKLITQRYNSGIAKHSDVEQASLLMQRIETELQNIEKEIEQYKSNIELLSGITFPAKGVQVPKNLLKKLHKTIIDGENAQENSEYNLLRMQADVMKENAYQQNSFLNINVVAEERFVGQVRSRNESYMGMEVKLNIFDLDKILNEKSQMKLYQAAKGKADYKYKESIAKIKNLKLIANSNANELSGLQEQRRTMRSIIKSQQREYEISQSSFYEMVNTLFDILTIERRIAELMIADTKNKLEYIQLTGKLAEIETLSK
ncbi:TolC family protein [Providencia vermicola]|uniref:TolC family protein n=1 Tax=Providencia vermicola TaxID=333965 RepID=UPI001CED63D0|nr:TolC family protein [Providencia vermicola]